MTIAETLLPELDQEMPTTRRLLERVPSDKAQWKPHPKSFALGHLAQLVATMPGWITRTVTGTEINLAAGAGYSFEKTETLVTLFDKHVSEARAAIAKSKDADYNVRSEEHTSELQSRLHLVCRLLLEKKKKNLSRHNHPVPLHTH